jgi:hypothetical protein
MSDSTPEQPSISEQDAAVRVNQFRFSVDLFKRNYNELSIFLLYFSAPQVAFAYSPVEQKWLWQEGMKEVSFLLHNFVAAALTLVDHTRVLYRHLYEPKRLIPSYTEQLQQRFISDPLTQFVVKLRQMAQHYRLPSVSSHTEFRNEADGTKVQIELRLRAYPESARSRRNFR